MLQLLFARGVLRRDELAELLQCKQRNISEYRKELEEAGFEIESTSGKYGGYRLKHDTLFPIQGLRNEELKALKEASKYVKSHADFLSINDFLRALDKIFISTSMQVFDKGIYMYNQIPLSSEVRSYIRLCEEARDQQRVISLEYKRLNANEYTALRIHPYEILHDQGSYYCLAYSLKAKDYRNFKFSDERMRNVTICDQYFLRDLKFQLNNYIGTSSLMKGQHYDLKMMLDGSAALFFREKPQGVVKHMEWVNDKELHVETAMEGRIHTMRYLLSLGVECTLLEPSELVDELIKTTEQMRSKYIK